MARSARLFQEANGFPEETFHRTPEFDVNKKNQDELDAFGLIKVDDFGRLHRARPCRDSTRPQGATSSTRPRSTCST